MSTRADLVSSFDSLVTIIIIIIIISSSSSIIDDVAITIIVLLFYVGPVYLVSLLLYTL